MPARLLFHALPAVAGWLRAWPSQCLVCHAWPAQPVCADCRQRFAPVQSRCHSCALPVPPGVTRCGACLRQPPPLEQCLCAVAWAWPWTHYILRMKFGQDPGLSAPLASLLAHAPGVSQALADADAVLPLPLSAQRLAERGYNPSLLLAAHLCARKTRFDWLLRPQHTPPQRGLPRAQRLRNVRGVFAVNARHVHAVQGSRLVLVDDVMTTGATMFEAARTLRLAGAARVTAVVLARAEDHAD